MSTATSAAAVVEAAVVEAAVVEAGAVAADAVAAGAVVAGAVAAVVGCRWLGEHPEMSANTAIVDGRPSAGSFATG